ncbi:MAG: OsmC-related (seleno)protein, partial [Anaerolineae bacterium]|nr:OsmC-related (seleno)protein [Anaerolineae bacterium]
MPSIEESGYPLAFKMSMGDTTPPVRRDNLAKGMVATRTHVRALTGMQKEAVVTLASAAGERSWRMVCDEGPYLDGTDLAPFPLAFFSAGLQFSLLSEVMRHARDQEVTLHAVSLSQDTFYTMNGSALQGTMIGGAKPVQVQLRIESDGSAETVAGIIRAAERTSPAHALMRNVLSNTFSLKFNEKDLAVTGVKPAADQPAYEPDTAFATAQPVAESEFKAGIITKVSTAERIDG